MVNPQFSPPFGRSYVFLFLLLSLGIISKSKFLTQGVKVIQCLIKPQMLTIMNDKFFQDVSSS